MRPTALFCGYSFFARDEKAQRKLSAESAVASAINTQWLCGLPAVDCDF